MTRMIISRKKTIIRSTLRIRTVRITNMISFRKGGKKKTKEKQNYKRKTKPSADMSVSAPPR